MARNPYPLPTRDPVVEDDRTVTGAWSKYFAALAEGQAVATTTVSGTVDLEAQAASISTTGMPIQTVYQGVYRVSYYARVTQAATSSSDITVTIGWTESSVSLSESSATANGNTTTTILQGTVTLLTEGGSSPITYATTYNSTGATAMQYRLRITAELVEV